VNIQYTYTSNHSDGNFAVVDQIGQNRSWSYGNKILGACPYIDHSGSTGPMNLNDPDNGDISFGGCTFSAAAPKSSGRR
jgi:hypothetical protein